MKKRLILLAGLGVGYILGSRTGRQSYEKLKAQLQELWTDPKVQETVDKANQSIREKAPAVADAVQSATDKVTAAAQELDGDEDADTSETSGSASVSTSGSTSASTPGSGSSATSAGAAASSSVPGSTSGASTSATTGPGASATSGSGAPAQKPVAAKTTDSKSAAAKAADAKPAGSTPKPADAKPAGSTPKPAPKPTPAPKKAQDVITDPSRSIEDEGPTTSATN